MTDYTPGSTYTLSPGAYTLTATYTLKKYKCHYIVYALDGTTELSNVYTSETTSSGNVSVTVAAPTGYTPTGVLTVSGSPLFRGWKDSSGTKYASGASVSLTPYRVGDEEIVHKFYVNYLKESDLKTKTVTVHLYTANHNHGTLASKSSDTIQAACLVSNQYQRVDETRSGAVVTRTYHYESGSFPSSYTPSNDNTHWKTYYSDVGSDPYVWKGVSSCTVAPSDSDTVTYTASTYNLNTDTVVVYAVWYQKALVRITAPIKELDSQGYVKTPQATSEKSQYTSQSWGLSEGKLAISNASAISFTLWSDSDLGLTDRDVKYSDGTEKTVTALYYSSTSYEFGSTYLFTPTTSEETRVFSWAQLAEPEVTVYSTYDGTVSSKKTSALAGETYHFGAQITYETQFLKAQLLSGVIDQYKVAIGSWEVTGTNFTTVSGTGSPIKFTPVSTTGAYSVDLAWASASYTLNVYLDSWVVDYTVTYGSGASPAITLSTLKEKLKAKYTASEVDAALENKSMSGLYQDALLTTKIDQGLNQTYDAFSADGSDAAVWVKLGVLPSAIELQTSRCFQIDHTDSFQVVAKVIADEGGDTRAKAVCTDHSSDEWAFTYNYPESAMTTAVISNVALGTHTLVMSAEGLSTLVTSAVNIHCGAIYFTNADTGRFVSLPETKYVIDSAVGSITYQSFDVSSYTARGRGMGLQFGGWSDGTSEVTEVTFSKDLSSVTLTALWYVSVTIQAGKGTTTAVSGVIGKVKDGDTILYALPTDVTHPTMKFKSWKVDGAEAVTVEGKAALGPGPHTIVAEYTDPDLILEWGRFKVAQAEMSESTSAGATHYTIGTRLGATWKEISSDNIEFNADGRPRYLKAGISALNEGGYPVEVYLGTTQVWECTVQDPASFRLERADLPEFAFEVEAGLITLEPNGSFTGSLGTEADAQFVLGYADGVWSFTQKTGKEWPEVFKLIMTYPEGAVVADVASTIPNTVDFAYAGEDCGNWLIISNKDSSYVSLGIEDALTDSHIYSIKTNTMGEAYFTEIFTPMIKTGIGKEYWTPYSDEAESIEPTYGSLGLAPRVTAGLYAVTYSAYVQVEGEVRRKMFIVTFKVVNEYIDGPLCSITKHTKSSGVQDTKTLYLAYPGVGNISLVSVEHQFQAKLTTIPVLTKSSEFNYCIDLGNKETITYTVTRTSPAAADDSSGDQSEWTNQKWLGYVKTFFDEWQNLNYDSNWKRAGGYELVYDPSSDAALPVMHRNVFLTSSLQYSYSRAIVNMSFTFVVASMLGRSAETTRDAFTIIYEYTKSGVATHITQTYYRDTCELMALPSDGDSLGMVGWEVFYGGATISADGRYTPVGEGIMYLPGAEIPSKAGETYFARITSGTLVACMLFPKALTFRADVAPLIANATEAGQEYYIRATVVGAGGGGGSSEMILPEAKSMVGGRVNSEYMNETEARSYLSRAFKGQINIKQARLGGGASSGALTTNVITVTSSSEYIADVIVGAGGVADNDGGMSRVILTAPDGTSFTTQAAGGGAGKISSYGKSTTNSLQGKGGESNFVDHETIYGNGEIAGTDGYPEGSGGSASKDASNAYPGSGGGAVTLDLAEETGVELYGINGDAPKLEDLSNSHSDAPSVDREVTAWVGWPNGADLTLAMSPKAQITFNNNIIDGVVNVAVYLAGLLVKYTGTKYKNLTIEKSYEYDSGWKEVSSLTFTPHVEEDFPYTDCLGFAASLGPERDYIKATGRIWGYVGRWYRLDWSYETVGTVSGVEIPWNVTKHNMTVLVKVTDGITHIGSTVPAITSRGAAAAYGNTGSYQTPNYGGGGCSLISPDNADYTSIRKDNPVYPFKGVSGADGLIRLDLIKIPKDTESNGGSE